MLNVTTVDILTQRAMDSDRDNIKYIQDSQQLLGVFPMELWDKILYRNSMESTEVVQNLSNASLFFRQKFHDDGILSMYLFPKVWPLLGQQYHSKYKSDASFNELTDNLLARINYASRPRYFCQDCLKRIYFQWFSGILNLRLVCRSWCNSVDQFYQHRFSNSLQLNEGDQEDTIWMEETIGQKDTKLLRHFRNSHQANSDRSPIINRKAVVHLTHHIISPGIIFPHLVTHESVNPFLETYGKHLWYCTLHLNIDFTHELVAYGKLKHALSNLPNVKTLHIHFHDNSWQSYKENLLRLEEEEFVQHLRFEGRRYWFDLRRSLSNLRAEPETNPLPLLEHLEFLKVTDLPPYFRSAVQSVYHARTTFQDVSKNLRAWNKHRQAGPLVERVRAWNASWIEVEMAPDRWR